MRRSFITIIFLLGILALLLPRATQAANPFSVFNIVKTINNIKHITGVPSGLSAMSPFGGKITESSTACKLHYWMTYPVPFPPFVLTNPGVPIPLFGTKITVSSPGIPASDIFTFPGITKIYANHHENKVGTWTLGQTFKADIMGPIIDKINSALDSIPPIIAGPITFFNFSLSCPDGKVIFRIGTS